jgi:hypothetical protein
VLVQAKLNVDTSSLSPLWGFYKVHLVAHPPEILQAITGKIAHSSMTRFMRFLRSTSILPVAYVSADVLRALFIEMMYASSPDREPPISPAAMVVVIEVVKLLIATGMVARNSGRISLRHFHLFAIQRCVTLPARDRGRSHA